MDNMKNVKSMNTMNNMNNMGDFKEAAKPHGAMKFPHSQNRKAFPSSQLDVFATQRLSTGNEFGLDPPLPQQQPPPPPQPSSRLGSHPVANGNGKHGAVCDGDCCRCVYSCALAVEVNRSFLGFKVAYSWVLFFSSRAYMRLMSGGY